MDRQAKIDCHLAEVEANFRLEGLTPCEESRRIGRAIAEGKIGEKKGIDSLIAHFKTFRGEG
jgi:hypothetical protein